MKNTIMYEIKYLPIALKDLNSIIDYMVITLCNKKAASEFIDALDHSVRRLGQFPYSGKTFQPQLMLSLDYRVLTVNNYLVFYAVIDQTIEIRRIVYARVDLDKFLSNTKHEY